jgi:hypothetical protein
MVPPDFTINAGEQVNIEHLPEDQFPGHWEATGLPPGLTIDPADGRIKGMMEDAEFGTYNVTISWVQTCRIGSGGIE